MRYRTWILCIGFVTVAFTIGACSSDNPLAPFQPEVTNDPDNFQLQATGLKAVTATVDYSWQNTGTDATVDHSTTTSDGVARVIIKDASGTEVYNSLLQPSLTEPTNTGSTGTWTIRLLLSDYTGTLNFRVQTL